MIINWVYGAEPTSSGGNNGLSTINAAYILHQAVINGNCIVSCGNFIPATSYSTPFTTMYHGLRTTHVGARETSETVVRKRKQLKCQLQIHGNKSPIVLFPFTVTREVKLVCSWNTFKAVLWLWNKNMFKPNTFKCGLLFRAIKILVVTKLVKS